MRIKILTIIYILLISCLVVFNSYAYHVRSHRGINEYIARNNIGEFSLDQYLKDNLDFEDGSIEELKQQGNESKVYEWLGYGGEAEDGKLWQVRYLEHFHDPTEDYWINAGLWGTNDSLIVALHKNGRWYGSYSLMEVRDYYFKALTSEDEEKRKEYYAETFRGLGQLMHLVEDSSVPLHTRNDAHVAENYEHYVEKNFSKDGQSWLSNSFAVPKEILDYNLDALPINASSPIARLVDTDKYNGENPNVTTLPIIGLSEYSNANFLSRGTIQGTFFDGNYTYPEINEYNTRVFEIDDPRNLNKTVCRVYYMHNDGGGSSYKLASVSMIEFMNGVKDGGSSLDKEVYKDYANRLVPKAAGYAARLLEYFFSGEIDLVIDDDDNGFRIENKSAGAMEGDFYLYYETEDDTARKPFLSSNDGEQWFKNFKINADEKSEVFDDFEVSGDDVAAKYILVFRGKLSHLPDTIPNTVESGSVIGKIDEINLCEVTGSEETGFRRFCTYKKPFPERFKECFENSPVYDNEDLDRLQIFEEWGGYNTDTHHNYMTWGFYESDDFATSEVYYIKYYRICSYPEDTTYRYRKEAMYYTNGTEPRHSDRFGEWNLNSNNGYYYYVEGVNVDSIGQADVTIDLIDGINDLQPDDSYLWRKYYQE